MRDKSIDTIHLTSSAGSLNARHVPARAVRLRWAAAMYLTTIDDFGGALSGIFSGGAQ